MQTEHCVVERQCYLAERSHVEPHYCKRPHIIFDEDRIGFFIWEPPETLFFMTVLLLVSLKCIKRITKRVLPIPYGGAPPLASSSILRFLLMGTSRNSVFMRENRVSTIPARKGTVRLRTFGGSLIF
jgi:hypothetical protein